MRLEFWYKVQHHPCVLLHLIHHDVQEADARNVGAGVHQLVQGTHAETDSITSVTTLGNKMADSCENIEMNAI